MISGSAASARHFDDPGSTLAEVGEEHLLDLLAAIAREAGTAVPLTLESGDDACLWSPPPGREVVVSQDALVEGKDFLRRWITPAELGARAFQVAVSDLAGMGAEAHLCLATLCAPSATRLDDVLAIQRGLCEAALASGCRVGGGDVSDIDSGLVLDVVVLGSVEPERALRRAGGRPGDLLAVTGTLGRAAAGLRLLLGGEPPESLPAEWRRAQLQPEARLAEGRALVAAGVGCGGDLSDGLLVDARRSARSSGCGAELWLDAVPVDAELLARFPDAWAELALGGGEDFELLVAAAPDLVERIAGGWPSGLAPLTVVGRLVEGTGLHLLSGRDGGELPLPAVHARHYA